MIIIRCSGMFRNVPCSMFLVPGFIDGRRLVWLVHREQRSPIWPFFQLNWPYNCSPNQFFVDSNDLKIKLVICDRVAMIKSTINTHIKLFALIWLVHSEQRSPIWPFFQLNWKYNWSGNRLFVDSNDLKITLCTCDRVTMIKSTTNRHIKLSGELLCDFAIW